MRYNMSKKKMDLEEKAEDSYNDTDIINTSVRGIVKQLKKLTKQVKFLSLNGEQINKIYSYLAKEIIFYKDSIEKTDDETEFNLEE